MAKRGKIVDFESVDEVARPERMKKYLYLILIICEDENTERVYFEKFKSHIPKETIFLRPIGTGFDPLGVVKKAIEEKKKLKAECGGKDVDEVWLVFDKDDADIYPGKTDRFNSAIALAEAEKFQLAYSNEVFELWLLLHLTNLDPTIPLPRAQIYEKLQNLITAEPGHETFIYNHGDVEILEKIALLGSEVDAIERAEMLINHHGAKHLLERNPVTFVNELIKNLYSWIKYYSYQ
ncbi:RloB-like protein [Pedobacter psychrotolerans]|uniref:RloB-like protein n=1 Tax=Pedobacter psychrotolerans TaxID=1843235 RepID=A0A4V2RZC0_9SPHI|nr:RloB family protein [Pedobacter psychrotolerans]TCO25125.1 RloB-like protein [Pedobacter psychrotolerans]GGE47943.1 hypothetical protein GCM10011413_12510 [Pedobacter psychrotolerans]